MTSNRRGTVVFLGAGASKAFGLPLTDEILPKIVERLRTKPRPEIPLFKGKEQQQLRAELKQAFKALYPGIELDKKRTKPPRITDVLSLIDHLILYGYPASRRLGAEKLLRTRRLLERAMMEVLIGGDLSPHMTRLGGVQNYRASFEKTPLWVEHMTTSANKKTLARFVKWLQEKERAGPLTVVTSNYDLVLETKLFKAVGLEMVPAAIDFGFDWRHPYSQNLVPRPGRPRIALYKLHGSLNWLRCDLCDQVYVSPGEAVAYVSFVERQSWANSCDCGFWPLRHVLVAPSMVRDIRDPHLLNVWRSATEALRIAKDWFLIGYSLPAEDLAIRSMLLRAFSARGVHEGSGPLSKRRDRKGPRITVVQRGQDSRPSYAAMFGESKFTYLHDGLEQLVGMHDPAN